MFTKQPAKNRPNQGQLPGPALSDPVPVRRAPKVASVIADDLTLEGGVSGEGELHVDGVVRGDIHIGRLTVGETGHVEGNVFADTVECRGRIVGSISAKLVRLFATAYVDGDVIHEQLAMETGAFFQGRSQKFQRPAAADSDGASAAPAAQLTPIQHLKAVD